MSVFWISTYSSSRIFRDVLRDLYGRKRGDVFKDGKLMSVFRISTDSSSCIFRDVLRDFVRTQARRRFEPFFEVVGVVQKTKSDVFRIGVISSEYWGDPSPPHFFKHTKIFGKSSFSLAAGLSPPPPFSQ